MRYISALIIGLFSAAVFSVFQSPSAAAEEIQQEQKEPVIVEVVKGDSLTKIAKEHNTTYARLYDANPEIEHQDMIYPGQKIRIPFEDEELEGRELAAPLQVAVLVATPQRSVSVRKPTTHTIVPASTSNDVWDRLARCESGGNWAINTGNGYYGGLQFTLSTWKAVGGSGYPHQASKAEQIKRGKILLARSGWGQWPACTAKLGLR